jgi:hypothetical protein
LGDVYSAIIDFALRERELKMFVSVVLADTDVAQSAINGLTWNVDIHDTEATLRHSHL